jgi:hypothetical protein
VNLGQGFVIDEYTLGRNTFDALIFGCYEGDRLIYVARTRTSPAHATASPGYREKVCSRFKGLEPPHCHFANLPEAQGGRGRSVWPVSEEIATRPKHRIPSDRQQRHTSQNVAPNSRPFGPSSAGVQLFRFLRLKS